MFAVRMPAGEFPSTVMDPANPKATSIRATRPLELMRQAMDEPALDGSSRSRFDEITAQADPAARRQEWIEYAEQNNDTYFMSKAMDPTNPHRGNGFGGGGQTYAPEYDYGLGVDEFVEGAEMWQVAPDGARRLVAVYDGRRWRAAISVDS